MRNFYIIFIVIEKKVKSPILPLNLFRNHGFLLGSLLTTFGVGFSWAIIFLTPLYLRNVHHYSNLETGLLLLVMTAMTAVIPPLSGHLYDKRGAALPGSLMFILGIIAYVLQLFFTADTSTWFIILAFISFGIAWGIPNGMSVPLALSEFSDMADAGMISGAVLTILNLAGVLSLSIASTLFNHVKQVSLAHHLGTDYAFINGFRAAMWLLIITSSIGFVVFLYQINKSKKNS